ncbi:hypothetical protein BU26DRAFT_554967 [Trematosphaeria pertusa]|uniref:Uncharacterized protein n=1 Tax=Trematosphaeria pertusa TaxID=390896 RepID=A0A6A6HZ48_9PLEO|nr:uncharacterized protein BU26DRAFT_554967 [Trematosphaeria pertusa]KAF2243485.1 hypothetical protein BU26DRAFT_554967 [Trematosphaeria pertusa]
MAQTNAPRRSKRLRSRRERKETTFQSRSRIQKTQSPSTTPNARKKKRSSSSSILPEVDLELLETQLTRCLSKAKRRQRRRSSHHVSRFFSASASSTCSTNEENNEEEEAYGELADLSADNVEWGAADDLDPTRNLSYDSRCEPGNEEYEYDGFVVSDDDVIVEACSESESEAS